MPKDEMGQSALLPRSLFGDGVKPGDTITMKVSAVFGDEVEVSATASSGAPEELEMEEEEPSMMSADEEIEQAATEGSNYGY
jgi:hypothetical protein